MRGDVKPEGRERMAHALLFAVSEYNDAIMGAQVNVSDGRLMDEALRLRMRAIVETLAQSAGYHLIQGAGMRRGPSPRSSVFLRKLRRKRIALA